MPESCQHLTTGKNDKVVNDGVPRTIGPGLPRRALLLSSLAAVVAGNSSCSTDRARGQMSLNPDRTWGAFLPPVTSTGHLPFTSIERLASLAGAKPHFVQLFAATEDSLPVGTLDLILGSGATPILTLEPWRPDKGHIQSEYALSTIANGRHDLVLSRWATELAAWPHRILLRFAQEMNGSWYPWSIGVNNNTAAEYRAAWSRMHSIVSDRAPQVRFVWAPNAITAGTRDFTDCYPGDDVVDYLGLDGYNWGQSPGHHWQSADKLFSRSLSALQLLSPGRPILITEVGCVEGARPDMKAHWIEDFFRVIERHPDVLGFLWFQMDKERDWRFNSMPASIMSFRDELARWLSGSRSR
ncbi:glycosyl hydrolase [Gordonia westfalica]|uniref:Glycosyl hydrolase n=1 Tax=Gordonia westfalica TaxID=158898 RepID=A0ABU2GX64_9ACTN|nr:glycosyl hydrolase [Gordonia westfalica]MDS1115996.1 glycosyl hydrolase [Gordonia westfalica]